MTNKKSIDQLREDWYTVEYDARFIAMASDGVLPPWMTDPEYVTKVHAKRDAAWRALTDALKAEAWDEGWNARSSQPVFGRNPYVN